MRSSVAISPGENRRAKNGRAKTTSLNDKPANGPGEDHFAEDTGCRRGWLSGMLDALRRATLTDAHDRCACPARRCPFRVPTPRRRDQGRASPPPS